MKKNLFFAFVAMAAMVLASCKEEQPPVDPTVAVTGVTISPKYASLVVGAEQQLTCTVLPENATNKDVTWTSGNPDIATVENGLVKAVAEGSTTITVETVDQKKTDVFQLTVTAAPIPVENVSIAATHEMTEGDEVTLDVTFTPAEPTNTTVTWTSSSPAIATVDAETGLIKAIAAGTTDIKVTTDNGGKEATCILTVNAAYVPVTEVTLDKTEVTIAIGANETIVATVTPDNATDPSVIWTSSNDGVVTVDNGTLTAVATGTATVTVKSVDDDTKFATCAVTVPEAEQKWARSNIVWVVDSSKPDGGYLTFAVTSADTSTIPSDSQGVYFTWGSLVATSPVSGSYDPSFIVFSPTGTNNYAFNSIPFLGSETAAPFANNVVTEDDFATYNGNTGFNESAGKGDVCRYISSKGWVTGSWRMPTASEITELIAAGKAMWPAPAGQMYTFQNQNVPNTGDNPYGRMQMTWGTFFGDGVNVNDDKTNPAVGVGLPACGYRASYGDQTSSGNYGCYWSSSSQSSTNAHQLDVSSGGGGGAMTWSSPACGMSVRCVRAQ